MTFFRRVCQSYGEYLSSKKYYEEAGIMFQRAGQCTELTVEAFSKSSDSWMGCLAAARPLQESNPAGHVDLCREMVDRLVGEGRYKEAAEVLKDHLGDRQVCTIAVCVLQHLRFI